MAFSKLWLIIYLVSFGGLLWQSLKTTSLFFSYPVIMTTTIIRPKLIEMPTVSVCLQYEEIEDKVINGVKQLIEIPPERAMKKFLTVRQILETSFRAEDAFDMCILRLPNGSNVSCFGVTSVDVYMDYYVKCFTLFKTNKIDLLYETDQLVGRMWVKLRVKRGKRSFWSFGHEVGLSIHPQHVHVEPNFGNEAYLKFHTLTYKSVKLSYSKITSLQLGPPYGKRCKDYDIDIGYESKQRLTDECVLRQITEKQKKWPYDVLAANELNGDYMGLYFGENNSAEERLYCNQQYPRQNCFYEDYQLHVSSATPGAVEMNQTFEALIYGPTGAELQVAEVPKYCLINHLTVLGGLIGAWIGLSVSDMVRVPCDFLSNIFSAFNHHTSSSSLRKRVPVLPKERRGRFLVPIVRGICWLGCFYQTYHCLLLYNSHSVQVQVNIFRPETIEMPAFTVCINRYVIESKVRRLYPSIYAEKQSNANISWDDLLTVQQWFDVTINETELFNYCHVLAPNLSLVSCFDVSQTIYRMNKRLKCFTLLKKSSFVYSLESVSMTHMVEIKFVNSPQVPRHFHSLSVHSDDVYPESESVGDHSTLTFNSTPSHGWLCFTYSRVERKRLPYPFKSNCVDYKANESHSRRRTINACVVNRTIGTSNKWPSDWFAMKGKGQLGAKFADRDDLSVERLRKEECSRVYESPDCEESTFFLRNTFSVKNVPNFCFMIFPPSGFQINLQETNMYDLIEVFNYVSGAIVIWLGISIKDCLFFGLSLFSAAVEFFRKRMRHRQSTDETPRSLEGTHPTHGLVHVNRLMHINYG